MYIIQCGIADGWMDPYNTRRIIHNTDRWTHRIQYAHWPHDIDYIMYTVS